jgi:hypothetical protein
MGHSVYCQHILVKLPSVTVNWNTFKVSICNMRKENMAKQTGNLETYLSKIDVKGTLIENVLN